MASNRKILMPGESAGLMSFSDNTLSKIKIPPTFIIVACIVLIVILWVLHNH